jgi:imidazole glycerol-phosphate synthase subunit HisH
MHNLRQTGLDQALETARQAGKPIMGICVGMQIMARVGSENGTWPGLGWLDAECRPLTPDAPALKLPHVGWNEITCNAADPLFAGLKPKDLCVYFVHSYALVCSQTDDVTATCEYGGTFAAAVRKDNLFATQFHPEKSQDNGLRILDNFLTWKP